ncbi:MBL fold metallo-hydrolase [Sporosarcina sp. HYO08]|uniref:MBL fold metallo-hydrolase n=1 Tax=Sporosarcina sp. HYO08 TaxID=1759557 RepID=UPI000793B002|nr:MBL fold metallo-hydrolase [Sporosarcina sp. HYO08]KXH84045.1 pyrroloquinoline quinone biosynthesis protein PqqB [Sporosarcina sp. HYO08]
MSQAVLHVLGTAQDAGLPHPNCYCENCTEAINNPAFRRFAASLAIVEPEEKKWHLIDATPDLKEQMIQVQQKFGMQGQLMDMIFLTHAHLGHYPGLLLLGREAIGAQGIPVMTGSKMKQMLEAQAPWSQLTALGNIELQEIFHEQAIQVSDQVVVTPVEVPHRNEFSETFAYWIEGPNKKVLYIPDIDRWEQWETDIYEACREADICLLDGTFHSAEDLAKIGRDYREIPHPLMTETMERLQELVEQTAIYFIHLNHSNPAIHADRKLRGQIEEKGFFIADEGMDVVL